MMNRRLLLAIAAIALAIPSPAQVAQPKITFSTVAVPVDRALAEISKQAGVRLTTVPMMASDILVLSVKDAPLEDVKARIASVLAAKWEEADGGLRLVPDQMIRRQQELKEQVDYTAQISKSLKKLVESLNPPKVDPKAKKGEGEAGAVELAAQMGFGASGNAAGKAVIRLANAIGAPSLALIDERSRIVYSSNPNRMQKGLPGNTNAILANLVTEYNAEAQVRLKQKRENPVPEEQDERFKKMREFFGNFEDDDKPIEGTPTKAILVCTRQQLFGGLTLTLKVYNEKGQVVITGVQTIQTGNNPMEAMGYEMDENGMPKKKAPVATPPNEKAIEFSATTKEFQSSVNFMTMAQGAKKMSDELKAKLLNPEMYDPLSFTHSEALLDAAKQRNKQLIACLPDAMESLMGMATAGAEAKTTPTSYFASIKDKTSVINDGNWLVITPLKPADARKRRLNRSALGMFIRVADKKGSFSLDDLADYAGRSVSPMEDAGSLLYIMLFAPNAMQNGMAGSVSWDMLRFYGGLSTLQKKNLAEGGKMEFRQCTPAQLAAVRQMVFGPEQVLVVADPNAKKPDYELPGMLKQIFQRAAGGDYRNEPTEIMPTGLPLEGYVTLKLTLDPIAKPAGNVPSMFGNAVMGADELAMLKFFKESESMAQFSAMMPQIDEVKIGERSVYDFTFTVGTGVTMSQTLNDDRMGPNAKVVKMANLPADFAKKIEERMAMIKKIPFFDPAFLGGGGQAVPPTR